MAMNASIENSSDHFMMHDLREGEKKKPQIIIKMFRSKAKVHFERMALKILTFERRFPHPVD